MQQSRTMSVVPRGGVSVDQDDSGEKELRDLLNAALAPHSFADSGVCSRYGCLRIRIHRAY